MINTIKKSIIFSNHYELCIVLYLLKMLVYGNDILSKSKYDLRGDYGIWKVIEKGNKHLSIYLFA